MVDGAGAEPVAGGADPGSELGPAVEEEVKGDSELVDWSVGDWVAGIGVDLGGQQLGTRLVVSKRRSLLPMGPGGREVVGSSTVEGAGRAMELDGVLQAFAATVEVVGALGGG